MLRVTTTAYPDTTQRVELDGAVYSMRLRWTERAGAWHMDLADSDGLAIVQGIRLVTLHPLLRRYRHLAVPPGELILIDAKDQGGKPTLEEMGERYRLYYVTAAELAATGGT